MTSTKIIKNGSVSTITPPATKNGQATPATVSTATAETTTPANPPETKESLERSPEKESARLRTTPDQVKAEQKNPAQTGESSVLADKPVGYFASRMADLGATPENSMVVSAYECFDDSTPRPVRLFTEGDRGGIDIHYVGLDGMKTYLKNGKKEMPYIRTRSHPDQCRAGLPKYLTPRGAGTQVFFPPLVLTAYQQQQPIKTLVITEGEFKAFKTTLHGVYCIGTQGIHNVHETDKQGNRVLNTEIAALIKTCQVNNVILLLDNDCLTVDYDPDKDLFKRPNSFYTAVRNFREYTKTMNCDVYFSHIRTDLTHKGIDDLLCAVPGQEELVLADLTGLLPKSDYFATQNISDKGLNTLKGYFHIANVGGFYAEYEDVIKDLRFRYHNAYYQYNGKEAEMLVSDEINRFIRVGDEYYEWIQKPDREEKLWPSLEKRPKTTIKDDYTANAIQYIKKYKAFCLVPSHTHYQQSVMDCYNAFHRIEHQPQPGDCPVSLAMVRHIFKEHYEFGLDYIQLLYTNPGQLLPILLFQSKERNTGKSTFANWLGKIFGAKAVKLGNADIENDFNSTYAEKLLVMVDETFLSKKATSEAVKRLSTETAKIWVNAKGRQQYETEWIGKFVFMTNTLNTALYIEKGEVRYFVRTINALPGKDDPDILEKLTDEIPAFLHFLQHRTLTHRRAGRMYFDFTAYKTPELAEAVEANVSAVEREIRNLMAESFELFADQAELQFQPRDIFQELKDGCKWLEERHIRDTLKKEFGLEPSPKVVRYFYHSLRDNADGDMPPMPRSRVGRTYSFKRADFTDSPTTNTPDSTIKEPTPF